MKQAFKSVALFIRSLATVLLFELIFKLILAAVGAPLFSSMLRAAMKRAKISYLTTDNIDTLLKSPHTWLILLAMLLIMAIFSIVELSGLVGCYAYKAQHKKITFSGMFVTGIKAFGKAFRGTGILSFIGFMFVIPLAQFTLTSGVFLAPFAPLIQQALRTTDHRLILTLLLIVLEAAVAYALSSRSYSLHFLVLTDEKFSDCMKKSRNMLHRKKLRMALELLLWSLLLAAVAAAVTFLAGFIVMLFIKGFSRPEAALMSALKVLSYAWNIFTVVSVMISAPSIICFLTTRFLNDTEHTEKILLPDASAGKFHPAIRISATMILLSVSIFLNFSYIQDLYRGNVDFGLLTKPQFTAHRGFSHVAPENSLYAFQEAINIGADYIELDVQQSSDGQLVVIHDSKIDRTTNGKGSVSSFTYDELSHFSCGEWFGNGEFSDAKIMLLADVLELCGDDIMLNIEIKKTGDPIDTAEKTVALLQEYKLTHSCYVTSFSYQALKAVKTADPTIKTALILTLASSAIYSNMAYIDAISVNYIFADQNMVSTAHKNGKKVFVWTVDNKEDIEHMTSLGVDNIITNRPDVAAKTIYSYGTGDFVLSVLESIFGT